MAQNVGYAPNPGIRKRNQVSYRGAVGLKNDGGRKASVPDSPIGRGRYSSSIVRRTGLLFRKKKLTFL